jgi:hypothetical protein
VGDQVGKVRGRGRKGWLPAFREAMLFKTAYAFGLFSGAPPARVSAIL